MWVAYWGTLTHLSVQKLSSRKSYYEGLRKGCILGCSDLRGREKGLLVPALVGLPNLFWSSVSNHILPTLASPTPEASNALAPPCPARDPSLCLQL